MRIFYDFLFVITLILLSFHAATTHAALRLNEIYPAPQSGNFEWVELYNDESSSVKISDYTLLDLAANAILLPGTTAPPFGIIVATSSGILNNTGDTVFLKHNGDTVDVATYSGSITADKSFARCPDGTGSWVTTTVISKSSLNTGVCLLVSPNPTSSPTATLSPTLTLVPSSTPTNTPTLVPTSTILSVTPTNPPTSTPPTYNNIIISEVFPYPANGESEWVELYNNNNFPVSLTHWYIDDNENKGSQPKVFSGEITPYGYFVVVLESSIFNNDADMVRLLDNTQLEKDKTSYDNVPRSMSWGRVSIEAAVYCVQSPSGNHQNSSCVLPSASSTTQPPERPSSTTTPVANIPPSATGDPQRILQPITSDRIKTLPFYESVANDIQRLNNESAAVLGTETSRYPRLPSLQYLSLFSFSLSVVSICSLVLKIRLNIV